MAASSKKFLYLLLGIVIVACAWLWTGYNSLVTSSESVDASWAQVETQYQRRVDLIPRVVSTVKGAADFEQETFIGVTEARTKWLGAEGKGAKIEAAQGFESALARLLVTFENYPQLKATEQFNTLIVELEGTENRIATARRDYNESVRSFNVRVKRFPTKVIAGIFGFDPQPFFEAEEGAENAPAVEF